jgi:hypothetical protein
MVRISRTTGAAWLAMLLSVTLPLAANSTSDVPMYEVSSTGLMTFSGQDDSIRVAVTFGKKDEAVVATLVRFLDQRGKVLKQHRGELRDGRPVVAELSRRDLSVQGYQLVRIEVVHKLPGLRETRYPILVTTQPIAVEGFARFSMQWIAGGCGCPDCGSTVGSGQHVDCGTSPPPDIEL